MLLEKYRPEYSKDVIGQQEVINFLNHFLKKWEKGKLVIVYGPSGTGKTSIVKSLANENNLEVLEINPENQFSLEILRTATKQASLLKKKRLIYCIARDF